MKKQALKPKLRLGANLPFGKDDLIVSLPFKRSLLAILFIAGMDVGFMVPAVITFHQAIGEWAKLDSLFGLVSALFLSGWLLGWMMAPLVLTLILLVLLFGRETIKARRGVIEIFIGVPGLGLGAEYDVSKMRNLRIVRPAPKSGTSWRGTHLAFDYGAKMIGFGSNIEPGQLSDWRRRIERAAGAAIRQGEALPEELVTEEPEQYPKEPPHKSVSRPTVTGQPVRLSSPSTLALIAANLAPVAGMVFLGWNLGELMTLYWGESAIIGFYNLLKMAVISRWLVLFAGPFFLGHFGAFMSAHFLFIYTFFIVGVDSNGAGDDLAEVAQLFFDLWPALLALFVSHGISFYTNFLGRREYEGRALKDQMTEPYTRIIIMHLTIIFGGGLTLAIGSPTPALLILIVIKIFSDVRAHIKERT